MWEQEEEEGSSATHTDALKLVCNMSVSYTLLLYISLWYSARFLPALQLMVQYPVSCLARHLSGCSPFLGFGWLLDYKICLDF